MYKVCANTQGSDSVWWVCRFSEFIFEVLPKVRYTPLNEEAVDTAGRTGPNARNAGKCQVLGERLLRAVSAFLRCVSCRQ